MNPLNGYRTHGMSRTMIYNRWKAMLRRCLKPQANSFPRYGGKGIKVCERWLKFENFFADMGEPPTKKHQIERKINLGPYAPWNCRWATLKEQARNKSSNHFVTFNGKSRTIAEWSELTGIPAGTIYMRLKLGWTVEKTLTYPNRRKNLSRFIGVSVTNGKWHAQITPNRKRQHLGFFNNEVEAAKAYNEAAIEAYGPNARINRI